MKTIWKFDFSLTGEAKIQMPPGAEILTCRFQDESLCFWALVDPDRAPQTRTFRVLGTGHPIPDEEVSLLKYIATVESVPFIWHIFELESEVKVLARNLLGG